MFVEVTGTDLPMVVLTLNIFAANLADRGATIEPIEVRVSPEDTPLGKRVVTPQDLGKTTDDSHRDDRTGAWPKAWRAGGQAGA